MRQNAVVESDWLTSRQHDGGIDDVPLPTSLPGRLWLCGKHAIGPKRYADPSMPWTAVICLCERHELVERYPGYVDWLDNPDSASDWWPIPDMYAPPVDVALPFVDQLVERIRAGERLLVHCAAGIGRTGTTAVCILIRLGVPLEEAEEVVGEARDLAGPESGAQRQLVDDVASLV